MACERCAEANERVIFLERVMNKQNSKKLNSKQKTIAVIALIVTVLLAICVTFAWYTNRINGMKGEVRLGSFNYEVSLYDVSASDYTVTRAGTKAYTNEKIDDTTFAQSTFQLNDFANNSVKYQVVKLTNNSGFGIKAYEYLSFGTLTEDQKTLANYFYFKPFKLSNNAAAFPDFPSEVTEASLKNYFSSHTANLPSASAIAAVDTDWTFGNLNNNSVALEKSAVSNGATEYYLLAYTLRGTTPEQIAAGGGFDLTPVIAIGQSNGPVPQTSGSAKAIYADSWYELKSAIASANPGDTVYLTANVSSPANTGLSIDNDINLNLNGYDLTVAGDLVFNYNSRENRNLTVPAASHLTVRGNMYVASLGAFSVNGSGSSQNILLGNRVTGEGGTTVTGGNLFVNCGLAVDQKTKIANASTDEEKLTAVTDDVIVEDSGFSLNNVVVQKVTVSDKENATVTVNGSNTMVKIGSGSTVKAVTTETNLNDIYIANYGTIASLNLANVAYPSSRNYDCGLYVVNYNTVSTISLSTAARGFKSADTYYNTRIKDAEGARTSFKNIVPTSGYFKVVDVEPFASSDVENSEVKNLGGGVYEVYLRNTNLNTETASESINALFTQYGFDALDCKELRMITTNAITLKTLQFTDIRDNFKNVNTVDLSRSAIADDTIPANAFNVTASTATNKILNLNTVVLPRTQVSIGNAAFKGTNIEAITITSNISSIGREAFYTNTNLEVTWDNSDVSTLATFVNNDAFDSDKTIIFMDPAVVQNAYNNNNFTDEWKLNMYENYDFKANQGTYYCKYARDGAQDACEIIYYAGTIADKAGLDLVPNQLNDGTSNYTVTGIKQQAFKKAIIADSGRTSTGVIVDLTNCTKVAAYAFEGNLTVSELSLGNVYSIGAAAFANNNIVYSNARPNTFSGMNTLEERAFAGAIVSGGIVDLHALASAKYAPGENVFAGFRFNGSYSGNASDNAVLDLRNLSSIPSNFAGSAQIRSDILLNGVGTISAGAFSGAIKTNNTETPTNIVDARDVKVIGEKAFSDIECNILYLGTHDASLKDIQHPYESIIGSTSGINIKTLVLDGDFATSDSPALASSVSTDMITIGTLQLTHDTTTIPAYAFATNRDVESGAFTMNPNLTINNVSTSQEVEGQTVTASFTIGDAAFKGTGFSATEKDFEGVTSIGVRAFAASTIVNLNLGEKITTIANENFIQYCDGIKNLYIETVLPEPEEGSEEETVLTDYLVVLGGTTAADEAFSSAGTTVGTTAAPFRIRVPKTLLMTYLDDNVWSGWENYFEAQVHRYQTGTAAQQLTWYYYIVNYADGTQGIHIITCEFTGTSKTLTTISVTNPAVIDGISVTELGADYDMFKNFPASVATINFTITQGEQSQPATLESINGNALQNPLIRMLNSETRSTNQRFVFDGPNGLLLRKNVKASPNGVSANNELVKVHNWLCRNNITWIRKTATTQKIPLEISKIQKGAFAGASYYVSSTGTWKPLENMELEAKSTSRNFDHKLAFIEAGAFDHSGVTNFDLSNLQNTLTIGQDAFGSPRELTVDSNGYYTYQQAAGLTITLPAGQLDSYKDTSSFYLYYKYGCLTEASGTSVEQNAAQTQKKTTSLKNNEYDITLGGVKYHLMNSGTEYEGTTYTSNSTKLIAVVTGLSEQTAASSTLIIPSTVSYRGINYTVVGITDKALGTNDVLETLILPNKDVIYSSTALAGCSKLGTIQYSDIVAYTENAENNVAALPAPSSKSLIEDTSEENSGE